MVRRDFNRLMSSGAPFVFSSDRLMHTALYTGPLRTLYYQDVMFAGVGAWVS